MPCYCEGYVLAETIGTDAHEEYCDVSIVNAAHRAKGFS